jgi:hypothetical protein
MSRKEVPRAGLLKAALAWKITNFRDRPRPHAGNAAHGNRTGWPRKPSSDGK